jgi:hypothetical protein
MPITTWNATSVTHGASGYRRSAIGYRRSAVSWLRILPKAESCEPKATWNSAAMHRILGLDRRCRLSRFQPPPHLVVWHNARLLTDDLPIAEDDKVGNSLNPETVRDVGVTVGIHLQHNSATGHLFGHLRYFWRGHAARPAPCRPEVHEHGHIGVSDDFIE